MTLLEALADKRVVICAGAGGVGKTTSAAALALGLATRGAKVAVVTIDPAKRLAGALGLDELDNEPRQIDPEHLGGLELQGELWAMMLDPKRTFDDLIDGAAPSPKRAQEIKDNRIYAQLSGAVAGSQEFTAIAKLYELERSGRFDVIVLDTPPSRSALEFLNAPARLESFLGGGALKAFLRPTGIGMRVFAIGTAPVFAALKRVTGIDVIADLSSFFTLLGTMTDSFDERARRVEQLLHAPSTAFVVISSPRAEATDETIWFRRTLSDSALPFTAAIVNRVHSSLGDHTLPPLGDELRAKLDATLAEHDALVRRDQANISRLREALGSAPVVLVPELDGEVNDLQGLRAIHEQLLR